MRNNEKRWNSLAESLREQHHDLRVENFLSFVYTADIVSKYLEIEFQRVGLTRTQNMILHFLLAQRRSMTPTELSKCTLRTKDTITKAINNLDKMGLTRSTRSKNDRRLRRVRFTDEGLDLMEKILPIRCHIFTQALNCLIQEDSEAFRSLLKQLREHIINLIENSGSRVVDPPEHKAALLRPLTSSK